MLLLHLQFGRVFHRDDSFFVGDKPREHVQERGFSGTGSARDDDVESCLDRTLQQIPHLRRHGVIGKQIFHFERNRPETANGQNRSIHRQAEE